MCLAVYLASSVPLTEISWNKHKPAFYLTKLGNNETVSKQFSLPHLYYAGAHTGCGCGFINDGNIGNDLVRCEANYTALVNTVRLAEGQNAKLQLFSCWEGDQGKRPEKIVTLRVNQLAEPMFEFKELELINVEPEPIVLK